jgi:hypothetical protein
VLGGHGIGKAQIRCRDHDLLRLVAPGAGGLTDDLIDEEARQRADGAGADENEHESTTHGAYLPIPAA